MDFALREAVLVQEMSNRALARFSVILAPNGIWKVDLVADDVPRFMGVGIHWRVAADNGEGGCYWMGAEPHFALVS